MVSDDGSRALVEPERLRTIPIFEGLPGQVLARGAEARGLG
jgi:hypothetical protein